MNPSFVAWRMPSVANPAAWMPRLVEASLVVAMAWVVSGWFSFGAMPGRRSLDAGGQVRPATLPVRTIADVPLFGEAASVGTDHAAPVAPSRLSIRLLGTVVAGPHSAAVLARRPGAKQQVFLLGQTIEPGVVLRAVEPEAVVVDHHGHMERIAMAKPTLVMAPPPSTGTAAGRSRIEISRASLDAQLRNLPTLLTQARASPHQMAGRPDGIMIDDIVPGSLYARAGLRNGDVIRSINGRRLTRMDQGIRMFQSLKDRRGIDIEIARGGTVRHLHYSIR